MGWRILSDPLPARLLHQVKVKLCSSRVSGILGTTQSFSHVLNIGQLAANLLINFRGVPLCTY